MPSPMFAIERQAVTSSTEDVSNLDAPLEPATARITDLEYLVARYEAIHSDLKQAPPKLKAELAQHFARTKSCIATTPGALSISTSF